MSNAPSTPPIIPPPRSLAPAPKRRWWPILLLALTVFVTGAGFGAAVTVIIAVHRAKAFINHPAQVLTQQLKRRLGLNAAQTVVVEGILTKRQQRLQALRQKLQPDVEKELEAARAELSEALPAEKRAKLDAVYEEIKSRLIPSQ